MGDNADPHLNFFWRKCDMCNIEYDVIGKAETSEEDLEFIFSKVRNIKKYWSMTNAGRTPQGRTDVEIEKIMKNIS